MAEFTSPSASVTAGPKTGEREREREKREIERETD